MVITTCMDNIKILKSQVAIQSIKYIITGGASYLVDFVLYWFFFIYALSGCGIYGLFAGLGVNYILSKYWVFENKCPYQKELLAFILLRHLVCAYGYRNVYMRRYIASER